MLLEKVVKEEFYGFFVNIMGCFNGYIFVYRRMEYQYLIKEVKEYIKYMFLNKIERNVRNRLSVILSIREIVEYYDEMLGCRRLLI